MLNQVLLVGRLVKEPTLTENEKVKMCFITLAVQRSYKNEKGEFETDFIDCLLLNGVAENTVEYCKKGDLIGIKGSLQVYNKNLQVRVDRVTFLTSKKD